MFFELLWHTRKLTYPQKFARYASAVLYGGRSGVGIGMRLGIVLSGVGEIDALLGKIGKRIVTSNLSVTSPLENCSVWLSNSDEGSKLIESA